jgi:hypothetical protein
MKMRSSRFCQHRRAVSDRARPRALRHARQRARGAAGAPRTLPSPRSIGASRRHRPCHHGRVLQHRDRRFQRVRQIANVPARALHNFAIVIDERVKLAGDRLKLRWVISLQALRIASRTARYHAAARATAQGRCAPAAETPPPPSARKTPRTAQTQIRRRQRRAQGSRPAPRRRGRGSAPPAAEFARHARSRAAFRSGPSMVRNCAPAPVPAQANSLAPWDRAESRRRTSDGEITCVSSRPSS